MFPVGARTCWNSCRGRVNHKAHNHERKNTQPERSNQTAPTLQAPQCGRVGLLSLSLYPSEGERIPRHFDALGGPEPQVGPLTPALSPSEGERGNRRQPSGNPRFRGRLPQAGEGTVRGFNARACSSHSHPDRVPVSQGDLGRGPVVQRPGQCAPDAGLGGGTGQPRAGPRRVAGFPEAAAGLWHRAVLLVARRSVDQGAARLGTRADGRHGRLGLPDQLRPLRPGRTQLRADVSERAAAVLRRSGGS